MRKAPISTLEDNPLSAIELRRTPLFAACVELGAKMTGFGGWEMPVQFAGLMEEHRTVRSGVGCFDISHMGKLELQGPWQTALGQLVPSDLSPLQPGQGKYTVLLNEQGGIVDDLIVYSEGADRATVIINAATTAKDLAWLAAHLDPAVTVMDRSPEQILIAVQGPTAAATLQPWITADLGQLKFYRSIRTHLGADAVFMARTGYTGEDGFEIMLDLEAGQRLWQRLIAAGVAPCGLGSRDTLRLEAAMALYGQDITEETTPFEGSLDWLVHLDRKGDFLGRAALEAQQAAGIPRRLVGLSLPDRHIARHDYPVLHQGEPVGIVTSGTFSPTLNRPIALAYVPTALAEVGQALEVQIRNKFITAEVVNRPFYRRPKP